MSANKTQNYQLHAWEPEDDFLLAEINENFAALDAATRMVTGIYQGDGAPEQFISLPATPKAVLSISQIGVMGTNGVGYGGLALLEYQAGNRPSGSSHVYPVVTIEEKGFRVYQNPSDRVYANNKEEVYHYIALW